MCDTVKDLSNDPQNSAEEDLLTRKDNKTDLKCENKTLSQKLRYIKSHITVEPILIGFMISLMLSRVAVHNLNLDKACRLKLKYGDKICDALIIKDTNDTLHEYELQIQQVISGIEAWKTVIQTALPTVLVIFMGAWSDRSGNRKLCIILPVVGYFCVCVSNIISTYFFDKISVEVTMFLEGFLPGITGDFVLMTTGVFSYISDVTDERSRTFRIGLLFLCITASIPMGGALSGILLKLWGYYAIFAIAGAINLLAICYALNLNLKVHKSDNKKVQSTACIEIVNLVKETIAVGFKKRSGNQRTKIIAILFLVFFVHGPILGEKVIFYLFLRYRLNWEAVMYSIYCTCDLLLNSVGTLFMISVFSKWWGWHDSVLFLISMISKLIGSICTAFVQTTFQMFMVAIVEILSATAWTSIRSMSSKVVTSEEMGKMQCLLSLVQGASALVFDSSYALIYRKTIVWFSGTVFIFSAFLTVPVIIMLIWIFIDHRKESKNEEEKDRNIKLDLIST